jgi:hypothetical protein
MWQLQTYCQVLNFPPNFCSEIVFPLIFLSKILIDCLIWSTIWEAYWWSRACGTGDIIWRVWEITIDMQQCELPCHKQLCRSIIRVKFIKLLLWGERSGHYFISGFETWDSIVQTTIFFRQLGMQVYEVFKRFYKDQNLRISVTSIIK